MLTHLDRMINNIRALLPTTSAKAAELEAAQQHFDALVPLLRVLNAGNIEALLPIRDVDLNARDLDTDRLNYGEDYEYSYCYGADGEVFDTRAELDEEIERQKGLLEKAEEALEEAEEEVEDAETALYDANEALSLLDMNDDQEAWEDLRGARDTAEEDLEDKQKTVEKLESVIDEIEGRIEILEEAEEEPNELIWNTIWRPDGDDVDADLANSIPQLGTITFSSDTEDPRAGETWLGLTSCGQDNGPAIMAYIALAHGVIDPSHVKYWLGYNRQWMQYVIGSACALKCAKALGIEEEYKQACEQDAAEAKAKKEAADKKEAEAKALLEKTPSAEFMAYFKEALRNPLASAGALVEDLRDWPYDWMDNVGRLVLYAMIEGPIVESPDVRNELSNFATAHSLLRIRLSVENFATKYGFALEDFLPPVAIQQIQAAHEAGQRAKFE